MGCSGWGGGGGWWLGGVNVECGYAESGCSCFRLRADHDGGVVLHGEGEEGGVDGAGDGIEILAGDVEGEVEEGLAMGFEECGEAG